MSDLFALLTLMRSFTNPGFESTRYAQDFCFCLVGHYALLGSIANERRLEGVVSRKLQNMHA